ncbi:hypothetical protein [Streptomyces sp. NBC_00083]|uniref:hypothetical protein n=1 Tax=Streptomyces sp. NBC_00083 TaxID=2975647 RepID=UPI002255E99E|nr:hypothetical protein [Streptomyces sp. NBC_00083]MCX5382035.1 hypothetical protein [Streptomyces sp. NBC_00083]
MGRGGQALARVAVVVRAGAAPLWWLGLTAAALGAALPVSLTGRRIGLLAGAAAFVVAAAVVPLARRRRYAHFAEAASRAAKADFLQDRAVTVRTWRRARRWWLLLAFLAAAASCLALPGAAGLLMAGAGAGLWLKATWLGRLERTADALLWVRTDWVPRGAPVGGAVRGFRATGLGAGDAAPGGSRRR